MIVHNFDPILVDFGLFQIRWYSIAYIFGIIAGWFYAIKIIKKNGYKTVNKNDFDDLVTYLIIGLIIGGRLGYVLFYNFEYYSQNILEIFKIWNGGMSFHGGLAGVIVTTFIFSKYRDKDFFIFTDIISCVAPIGIFLGRLANFINAELVGKISTLPWAVIFPQSGNLARHPSQIYEAFLEGIVLFIILNLLALKKKLLLKKGFISSLFLILYSIFRMISENFREPDKNIGYLFNYFSMGTLLSILTLLIGLLIIFLTSKTNENNK